jgi:hypothetical protein
MTPAAREAVAPPLESHGRSGPSHIHIDGRVRFVTAMDDGGCRRLGAAGPIHRSQGFCAERRTHVHDNY